MSDPTVSKTCFECHQTKPAAEFYPHPKHRDGLSTRCRPCALADEHRRWHAKHPNAAGRWPAGYEPPAEKVCLRCETVKPLSEFHVATGRRDKTQVWCKACVALTTRWGDRAYHAQRAAWSREWGRNNPDAKADIALKTRLGVPHGTYARLFAKQGGVCAICGTDTPGGNAKRRFHLDHNATTGSIRGLLCGSCNLGIGRFHENPATLRAAANYLEEHSK